MASGALAATASRAGRRFLASSSKALASLRLINTSALAIQEENPFLRYSSPIPVRVDHTPVLAVPETRVTTLGNGLRVASEAYPLAETATIGVWIDAGSRFESDKTNGTAHFLEHMIFKGTKRRSVTMMEMEVENMGAHLNAYTSREMTTYYAKIMKRDVGAAVDLLADILQNSEFDPTRIDQERNVILREMQEVEKVTEEVVFDHLHATAFQFSPLGRTILGSADNIRGISQADLRDYIATHYTGPRMVLVGAGAVDHNDLVKLAEKHFGGLPSDPTTAAELVAKAPGLYTGSEVRIRDDDRPHAHFAVAFRGASWTDPDAVPLMVMHSMLGSWSKDSGAGPNVGSEMGQLVAANDLADSVMAFNTNYKDIGLFGVYAISSYDKLEDLAWVIMQETAKMVYRVNEDDVIRAQNQLKSSLLLHQDGTSAIAEDIGRQLLTYGRRLPLAELFARIDAVDAETVKRVADRFIYDKDVVIASLGPTQFLPDYNWFRRRTYWLRY